MDLSGKKIALLATDYFEDSELLKPMQAVMDAGGEVDVISDKKDDEIVGEHGASVQIDKKIDEVRAEEYDGLLIPGGVKNPDVLRQNKEAVNFVNDFFALKIPVAAICHGPWLLVEADVLQARVLT